MNSFDNHVEELQKRLRYSTVFFILAVFITFYFSPDILTWLKTDLGFKLHAFTAYEALYTRLMISLLGGFVFSLPITLYQLIKFMQPGLKPEEYRVLRNYIPLSIVLFVVGSVFSYQFIVKTGLEFFSAVTTGSNVEAVWGLRSTVGFALRLSTFTGIVFQLPIVAVVLDTAGLINEDMMREYRNYFLVSVLLVSAVATPPDIFTQVLVTVPVVFLYQLSIFLVSKR